MASTLHYKFPLMESNSKPSWLTDWNSTVSKIDSKLYELAVTNPDSEEFLERITDIEEDIQTLSTTVEQNTDDITDLNSALTTIQESVTSITSSVDTLNGAVETMQGEIGGLNTSVETIQGDISDLDERVTDLEETPGYELPIASANELGGIKVGNGLSVDANGVLSSNGSQYTLPPATTNTLGGVIVGNGLSVDSNGEISNDNPTPYSLPIASQSQLGGVKVGSGLSINEQGELNATGGQTLTDAEIGCKSLIYQIRNNMEVDRLLNDYNIKPLYSKTGRANFGIPSGAVSPDRRGLFTLDVVLSRLDVSPTNINAQFSIEPDVDSGEYISHNLRDMKIQSTLIDGTFHTNADDNTPTMISGLGMYEEDWQTPGTFVFRPYCNFGLNWYDLVQSGDLSNDQFQLLQNAIYQYSEPYQQELFRFGFGNTNNPNSPLVKLCIMASVNINMGGINVNLSLKYSSNDLTNSPSVFPTGFTKPSDYVKTPVYNDVSSTERNTTVALGQLDGASATINGWKNISMIGSSSSFSVTNRMLNPAGFDLILAEGNAISD